MTNKLVVIKNSLKVPKIKKILLYEMKFLVPNYSCLQNPWLVGYRPQIPVLSVLCPQLNLLNPPTEQNSCVRHWFADLPYLFQLINKFHEANPFTDVNIFSFSREIPAPFNGPRRLIAARIYRNQSQIHSLARRIQAAPLYTFYLRPIPLLFYRVWEGLPSRLFHFRFSV